MMKIKLLILLVLLACLNITAQNREIEKPDLTETVIGFVFYGDAGYLVTSQNMLKVTDENDQWQEYYRKVYNDSTIISPNFILPSQQTHLNFCPLIDLNKYSEGYFKFDEKKVLGDFLQTNQNGQLIFIPDIINDLLKQKQQKKKKN